MNLTYKSGALVGDLTPGECTVHRAGDGHGKWWWILWAHVEREDQPGMFMNIAVPVNPRRGYDENGVGGRTWGLADIGDGVWRISPSINVINDSDAQRLHPGEHPTAVSSWHQTPDLVGVPTREPWQ